jgi:hypothetical protein
MERHNEIQISPAFYEFKRRAYTIKHFRAFISAKASKRRKR